MPHNYDPWRELRLSAIHLSWLGSHMLAAGLAELARMRPLSPAEQRQQHALEALRSELLFLMPLFDDDALIRTMQPNLEALFREADAAAALGISWHDLNEAVKG